MADTCNLLGVSGTESMDSQDSITLTYIAEYDSTVTNFYTALARARAVGLPARRSLYASTSAILVAQSFSANIKLGSTKLVEWTVTFGPPEQGDGGGEASQVENPLDRPTIWNVEYYDIEVVVDKAKNLEVLDHGDGKGGTRAAGVRGPIVNAAGKRPDEPIMRTKRLEVLVGRKNFAQLADIVNRNRTYKGTTNSDGVQNYTALQLAYQLTESLGQSYENGVLFYPGEMRILAQETTDLTFDNTGIEYWDAATSKFAKILDRDGDPINEPINLKLDGDQGGDNTTTITYRDLEPVAYAPLFA